jgi:predicted oxidoreductase
MLKRKAAQTPEVATDSSKRVTDFIDANSLLDVVAEMNVGAEAAARKSQLARLQGDERDLKAASRANRKFRLSGAR